MLDRDGRVQRQARALGRSDAPAIFRAVADADFPTDVATLTARFGLNHNALRQHLAKLCATGLVIEEVGPSTGRGRHGFSTDPLSGLKRREMSATQSPVLILMEAKDHADHGTPSCSTTPTVST